MVQLRIVEYDLVWFHNGMYGTEVWSKSCGRGVAAGAALSNSTIRKTNKCSSSLSTLAHFQKWEEGFQRAKYATGRKHYMRRWCRCTTRTWSTWTARTSPSSCEKDARVRDTWDMHSSQTTKQEGATLPQQVWEGKLKDIKCFSRSKKEN